ncbi:MAG: hypothetical protein L0J09_09710 [Lactococcus lactis]|nr:hypothetical protein [Lactococcus lactis]
MSHLKNNLVFSSLTILLVTVGSLGLAQSAHNKVSSQKLEAKNVNQVSNYSGDIDLLTVSQPTTPTTNNGQINQYFINRFDNAISLLNGKYVVNHNVLPQNTSGEEINKLNESVKIANQQLIVGAQKIEKSDIDVKVVQKGNSIILAENPTTLKNSATSMATKHVGVTKVEFHWYGVRLFLSKNDVNKILKYGPTSVSIATIWMPTTWVVKLAASAAVACGWMSSVNGGIWIDWGLIPTKWGWQ